MSSRSLGPYSVAEGEQVRRPSEAVARVQHAPGSLATTAARRRGIGHYTAALHSRWRLSSTVKDGISRVCNRLSSD
eukprot:4652383-Pleurochrysis_carterae.AAC.2